MYVGIITYNHSSPPLYITSEPNLIPLVRLHGQVHGYTELKNLGSKSFSF
jgi:hypothetical protein